MVGSYNTTNATLYEKLNFNFIREIAPVAVMMGSPADFAKLIADETEKWGKVIRATNIKAD
jgi:hypothetical protein